LIFEFLLFKSHEGTGHPFKYHACKKELNREVAHEKQINPENDPETIPDSLGSLYGFDVSC
jgi:hypothetical protein